MSGKDANGSQKAQVDGKSDLPERPADIDQVRDLLFGSQVRETDKRFSRLEKQLLSEAADLREELRKRFDTLERYIKTEVAAVLDRVQAEADERKRLDERTSREHQTMRGELLDQSQELRDEQERQRNDILDRSEQEFEVLRAQKVDQSALASLFAELAMRINSEVEASEKKLD